MPEQTPGQEADREAFLAAVHRYYGEYGDAMQAAFETKGDEEFAFALWRAGKEYGARVALEKLLPERKEAHGERG